MGIGLPSRIHYERTLGIGLSRCIVAREKHTGTESQARETGHGRQESEDHDVGHGEIELDVHEADRERCRIGGP